MLMVAISIRGGRSGKEICLVHLYASALFELFNNKNVCLLPV